MPPDHPRPDRFHRCRAGIHELLIARTDVEAVERAIDAYPLNRDEKSALWLWASAQRDGLITNGSGSVLVGRKATQCATAGDTDALEGGDHDDVR